MVSVVEHPENLRKAEHFRERIEDEKHREPVCTIVEEEVALLNDLLSRIFANDRPQRPPEELLSHPWGLIKLL